jgi:hypothetical protein
LQNCQEDLAILNLPTSDFDTITDQSRANVLHFTILPGHYHHIGEGTGL